MQRSALQQTNDLRRAGVGVRDALSATCLAQARAAVLIAAADKAGTVVSSEHL